VAKQAAADRELRDKLLACCNGDFTLGPALDDLSPIKLILEVVPLDHIHVCHPPKGGSAALSSPPDPHVMA
jgi:hypothetical protein